MTDLSGRTATGNPRPLALSIYADNPEEVVEAGRARTGRSCGDCSMCCKLLGIDEQDIKKPVNEWCTHCNPGAGCRIYDNRPPVCRGFGCEWLVDSANLGEEWKPSRSKIVVHKKAVRNVATAASGDSGVVLAFVVDPSVPDRWREAPFYRTIKAAARAGLTAPDGFNFCTQVHVGHRFWVVLPDDDVDITGPGKWEVLKFSSIEKARGFMQYLQMCG
jgi:hypothetical protein